MMTSSSMSLTPYQSQLLSKHRLVASCWMQNDERDQKRHILTSAIYQIGKISMKNRKKGGDVIKRKFELELSLIIIVKT